MTHWHISESGATIELDPALRGEAMFTVRNGSPATDRVVLAVEPLDGAADTWLTVEDAPGPRRVGPGDSVTYVTTVAVPVDVAAGTYGLQARVYSADTDPSETSITSKRISFTKPGPGGSGRNWRKLWPLLLIPVVLLVGLGAWLALRDSGGSDDEVSTETPDPAAVVVAPVLGTPVAEARTTLEAQGLVVAIEEVDEFGPPGTVVAQQPDAGTSAAPGDTVTIRAVTYHLPSFVSGTADAAAAWLGGKDLASTRTTRTDAAPAGTVLSTTPAAGAEIAPDTTIGLEVSSGPPGLAPYVFYMSLAEANQALSERGLSSDLAPEENSNFARGLVVGQDPLPGMPVPERQPVTLTLASGRTTVPGVVGTCYSEGNSAIYDAGLRVSSVKLAFLTLTIDVPEPYWYTYSFGEVDIQDMFISAVTATGEVDVGTSVGLTLEIRGVACPGR
jgi:beta-lactam-binding protein with PASTA domain